jgi:hypothetical protein
MAATAHAAALVRLLHIAAPEVVELALARPNRVLAYWRACQCLWGVLRFTV